MSILHLLSTDGFISVNKILIKKIGLEHAVIIGELSSEYDYYSKRRELTQDGYFFSTVKNIEERTTIKEKRQRLIMNDLEKMNLIHTVKRGMPSKRYIKLNENELFKLFRESGKNGINEGYSSAEMTELVPPTEATNKNIINKNINNNIKDNGQNEFDRMIEQQFEEFWKVYYNRKKRQEALKSFIKAVKKHGIEKVMNGTYDYIKVQQQNGTDKQYLPHPTTFLNQAVYLDDMSEYIRNKNLSTQNKVFNPWEVNENAGSTNQTNLFDNSSSVPNSTKVIGFESLL